MTAQAAWGGWFIAQTSFEIGAERYFCLYDDAMISMTFARNLLDGFGLNWARWGAPVEGFTNPLWTYGMVPINALPIADRLKSLPVQLVSLLCLLLTTVGVYRLTLRLTAGCIGSGLAAATLSAFYYPLHHWALRGFAMGLQAWLMVVGVRWALDRVDGKGGSGRLIALLAIAPFVRMDMALFVAVVFAFVTWHRGWDDAHRTFLPRRAWLAMGAILAPQLLYVMFRLAYFGDPLPNPYYLKLTGATLDIRVIRGLEVFARFVAPMKEWLIVMAIGSVAWMARRRDVRLPIAVVISSFAYSIYTGGDAWEHSTVGGNRFVCVAMPLLFAVSVASIAAVTRRFPVAARRLLLGGFALLLFATSNGWVRDPDRLERHANWLVAKPPHAVERHRAVVEEVLTLARWLPKSARLSVVWAGIPGFFSDFELVDFLGFSDREIARGPVARPLTRATASDYLPGHMKWDMEWVLEKRRPDLFFQLWPPGHDYAAQLGAHGYLLRPLPVRRGEEIRQIPIWVRADADLKKR